jgi:sigma-B regulation protein RsbU (phosphoserine phosphatase)
VIDDQPAYPRVYSQSRLKNHARSATSELTALCGAFERATGFQLLAGETMFSNDDELSAMVDGLLTLGQPTCVGYELNRDEQLASVEQLAFAISNLAAERQVALHALAEREAELATAIPVTLRRDPGGELARQLEAVLRDASLALGCAAAAVYMLDDGTSQLKLRAGWGLPRERFVEAARPLRGAISDLEAMLGHIVVLDDTSQLPHWRSPEQAAAAACLPLSSHSTPLGTLWFFADRPGSFADVDARILELVAGRVVAELEREAVTRERGMARQVEHQLGRARQWQDNCLPVLPPALDRWQLAGWTSRADRVGGGFHTWTQLADESLMLAVGRGQGGMLEAALTAAAVQSALMMEAQHVAGNDLAGQMLDRIHQYLWTHSAGDKLAELGYAVVNPQSGRLRYAAAGGGQAVIVRRGRTVVLPASAEPLGGQLETRFPETRQVLEAGDVLMLYNDRPGDDYDGSAVDFEELAVAAAMVKDAGGSADEILDQVCRLLQSDNHSWSDRDCSLLVLRRDEPKR